MEGSPPHPVVLYFFWIGGHACELLWEGREGAGRILVTFLRAPPPPPLPPFPHQSCPTPPLPPLPPTFLSYLYPPPLPSSPILSPHTSAAPAPPLPPCQDPGLVTELEPGKIRPQMEAAALVGPDLAEALAVLGALAGVEPVLR